MAKNVEKPADMDRDKLREEGQAAENERMAAENAAGEAGHKARSSSAGHKAADS